MKTVLLSVFDKKSKDFGPIYTAKNQATATREFINACQENTNWKKYPEDFCLCQVGEFDTETGKVTPLESTKVIAEAENFVEKEEKGGKKI